MWIRLYIKYLLIMSDLMKIEFSRQIFEKTKLKYQIS